MVTRVAGRTFIVRVSDAPRRVVVEDVRTQERVVAAELTAVGPCIARLLGEAPARETAAREDSVSAPP
jgi:hypothetical protein